MTYFLRRNGILMAILAAVVILCIAMVCLNIYSDSDNAEAASGVITDAEDITVGHITDTHYYPFRLGYYGDITSSTDEDFFYNYIMDKNTKLWLEAEAVFDTAMLTIKNNAPQYLVLSGDVGQDGELLSHIDVANKLRKLQNDIRTASGNDSFQIFVVMGNHDLYNPESWRFDNNTGLMEMSYYASRMDIALIYAGLGYPNISTADANTYYSYLASDLTGSHSFVQSYLSSDFNYAWEFIKDDELGNLRTFTYDTDATASEKEEISMANFLSQGIVSTINNSNLFATSEQSYRYENFDDGTDIDIGLLTYIAQRKDYDFTVIGLDVVISNALEGHVLGGQLQNYTQDWMTENATFARYDVDTVVIGIAHHSILPHWGMEEQITTGFIVYNWEEVSDFLADYGMRYVYTGHMHANDTTSKVSFNGNQIIDMETSANCSVGSSVKITRIHHGTVGTAIAEQAYLRCIANNVVDIETGNVQLYSKVVKDDKYGYVAKNKVAEYINNDTKQIDDYSNYALRRVYENAIANKLNEYLKPSITEMIGGFVEDLEFSIGGLNISLGTYADDLVTLANNLIKAISTDILTDYTYKGTNETYKKEEYKVFGYLEDLINDICYDELADGIGIYSLVIDSYASHCDGTDVNDITALSEAKQEALNKIFTGEFVENLFEKLLDRETGLYRLIEGLQNTTLDLSAGISTSFKNQLAFIGSLIGFTDKTFKLDLASFNLGAIIKVAGSNQLVKNAIEGFGFDFDLSQMSLTEIIDDLVDKYLTESFEKALGEYAYDVITNFAVDSNEVDCTSSTEMMLTVSGFDDADSKIYTYIQKTRTEEITVENGKLPSMITTNFGSDATSTENFTYFTDRRVTVGGIQYVEVASDGTYNKNAATYKAATTELYATTKPLIDLGIWCQSGYVELGRHTVALTGLKADKTYAYRLGDTTNGYWSDWYTFTTAPSTSSAFEVLIGSDLQSSTEYAYERLSLIYGELDEIFTDNIAFMINPGDAVDNGRNLSQYEWWLNSATEFYASTATVIAAGNHDEKYFALEKASNITEYGGVSETANVSEYNYLYTHFNYDLPASQSQSTGFYYSFDYSGVHFTVLNTNDITDDKLSTAQYDWLINDLKAAGDKLKVIIMHKSLYSAGSHSYDDEIVGMRAQLTPIFAENGVSLVIAGHDHTYTETFYLDANGDKVLTDANGKNEITGNGTLYLTMGTMGEKFYNYVSNPEVPVNTGYSLHEDESKLSNPTFGKLVYDGTTLSYYGYQYIRTLDALGNVTDGYVVEINKSLDWSTLTAIILAGTIIILIFAAIIITSVKHRRIKKLNI